MTKPHYTDKILQAYNSGYLNDYMTRKVIRAVQSEGLTDDLLNELLDDAINASSIGVDDDRSYRIYFFANRFAGEILKDTFGIKIADNKKTELCRYALSYKESEYDFRNIDDYRVIAHKWLCDNLDKKAYPNISGKEDRMPVDDLDKWVSTLKDIYSSLSLKNMDKPKSIAKYTFGWDNDEKQNYIKQKCVQGYVL
jgi:hypothetical protein